MATNAYHTWQTTPIFNGDVHLTIIMPTFNEGKQIIQTIETLSQYICSLGFPWELIVSDRGSFDNTVNLVKAFNWANMRILETSRNRGKGTAVKQGVLCARGKYILFVNPDHVSSIGEVKELLAQVNQNKHDIAIGSRAVNGANPPARKLSQHMMSYGFRWLVRVLFGLRVGDVQYGLKLFTREAGIRLHMAQTITGHSFDLEVLYLAAKLGYHIAEVPVNWMDFTHSAERTQQKIHRLLRDAMQIKWNDVRGVYANA